MKKVLPLSMLAFACIAAVLLLVKNSVPVSDSLSLFRSKGLSEDQAAIYRISLKATRISKGKPEATLAFITGDLIQVRAAARTSLSRWSSIDRLEFKGHPATDEEKSSLIGKDMVSVEEGGGGLIHYLDKEFPKKWYRMQLNFLQRLLAPSGKTSASIFQAHEREEMGQYIAEYRKVDRNDHYILKKQFVSYDNPQIVVNRSQNTVRYRLSKAGRLLSADGDVGFAHEAAGGGDFLVSLKVELIAVEPRPIDSSIDYSSLQLADDSRVRLVAAENRATDTIGFEQAMEFLSQVTRTTDGRDIALIYDALKQEMRARPESGRLLRDRILSVTDRDEGSLRQLAAAFGALAQSDQPAIANLLANLISACEDLFCKDQAIVALNDHAKPTPEAARRVMDLINFPSDKDLASAAALSLGSIARKIGAEIPEARETLIEAFKNPRNAAWRRSILAGMGNHGDGAYLPQLIEGLKSRDLAMRASSLYGLRHLEDGRVSEIILSAIEKDKDAFVLNEGLKASAFRNLPAASYQRLALRIAEVRDDEDAKEATRLFIKLYDKDPANAGAALKQLRDRSLVPNVKSVIGRRLDPSTRSL